MKSSLLFSSLSLLLNCAQCDSSAPLADSSCRTMHPGCDCKDGDTKTCGVDVGICHSTELVCTGGRWPDCLSQAKDEDDCSGQDLDCDGVLNNIPAEDCWDGPPDSVFVAPSICRMGHTECAGGHKKCVGEVLPNVEHCGSKSDSNCNGLVEDNPIEEQQVCGPQNQVGTCKFGHMRCNGGDLTCEGAVYPEPDTQCDGLDTACTGTADQNLYRPCHTTCGEGVESCSDGSWVGCTAKQPAPDVCGEDRDCSGEVDPTLMCVCNVGDVTTCHDHMIDRDTGAEIHCGEGIKECEISGQWGKCYFWKTETESCNNYDDNCVDGIDENLTKTCGAPDGSVLVGACRIGTSTCTAGSWSDCSGYVGPSREECNQIDDDCNGLVDDGLNPHDQVDMMFAIDQSGSMCLYIYKLKEGIHQYVDQFLGTPHRFGLAVFPGNDAPMVPPPDDAPYPNGPGYTMTVLADLRPIDQFEAALARLGCAGGGYEPSYDVMWELSSDQNPEHISWRTTAYPYLIMVTDEEAQTWRFMLPTPDAEGNRQDLATAKALVTDQVTNCTLPGCHPGDKIDVFVVTHTVDSQWQPTDFNRFWDTIVGDQSHIMDILPITTAHYVELLNEIFRDVCR